MARLIHVRTWSEDARRGARGTVERAVFPDVDGARVQSRRVARRHDIRVEVSKSGRPSFLAIWLL